MTRYESKHVAHVSMVVDVPLDLYSLRV